MANWIVVIGSLVALAIYWDSEVMLPMSIVSVTVSALVLLFLKISP